MISKPLRIGIYGITGVGKTTFIRLLEKYPEVINTVDGSAVMEEIIDGGIVAFKKKSFADKTTCRRMAIAKMNQMFSQNEKHFVIAGHYCFTQPHGYEIAWTDADAQFYDAIFAFTKPAELIYQQILKDQTQHCNFSVAQLEHWQNAEIDGVHQACQAANIPLYLLDGQMPANKLEKQFIKHLSSAVVNAVAQDIIALKPKQVVLCDCDGTLNHDDVLDFANKSSVSKSCITALFKQYPNYCFSAFYDVSQYLDFTVQRNDLTKTLTNAEKILAINPVMSELLKGYVDDGIPVVFISCGFPGAWAASLGVASHVVGGASFAIHGCIITNQDKTMIAKILSNSAIELIAFGNGQTDIGMLKESDTAYYVYSNTPKATHLSSLLTHKNLVTVKLKGRENA